MRKYSSVIREREREYKRIIKSHAKRNKDTTNVIDYKVTRNKVFFLECIHVCTQSRTFIHSLVLS